MPHPQGQIKVDLKKKGKSGIEGTVVLPEGLKGRFIWKSKSINLKAGEQKIDL